MNEKQTIRVIDGVLDLDRCLDQQANVAAALHTQSQFIRNCQRFGVQVGITGDADILEAAARVLDRLTAQGREVLAQSKGGDD